MVSEHRSTTLKKHRAAREGTRHAGSGEVRPYAGKVVWRLVRGFMERTVAESQKQHDTSAD